jgi:hypothetical protein
VLLRSSLRGRRRVEVGEGGCGVPCVGKTKLGRKGLVIWNSATLPTGLLEVVTTFFFLRGSIS